jgi:hypothetical protein
MAHDARKAAKIKSAHEINRALAERLTGLGRVDMAFALSRCTVTMTAFACKDCHSVEYRVEHCRQRLCAHCGPKRAAEQGHHIFRVVEGCNDLKFITLTMPRAAKLAPAIDKILKAFKRWRAMPEVKKFIKGGFRKLEAKVKPDGWHVHIHCIVSSKYFPWQLLIATWGKAIGQDGPSTDIRPVQGKAVIRDCAKYAAKADHVRTWTQAQLDEFLNAMANRRTLQAWGCFFAADRELKRLESEHDEPCTCPHCKAKKSYFKIRDGPFVFGADWQYFKAIWSNVPLTIPNPEMI